MHRCGNRASNNRREVGRKQMWWEQLRIRAVTLWEQHWKRRGLNNVEEIAPGVQSVLLRR